MKQKRLLTILLAVVLLISVTAYSNKKEDTVPEGEPGEIAEETAEEATEAEEPEEAEEATEADETAEAEEETEETAAAQEEADESDGEGASEGKEGKALVVFFSATGTTKGVAERIAAITGADIYEIVPAEPYTEEDLNWHDDNSRTTHEQNDATARPEIGSEPISLDGYDTIYFGYPIWWGVAPRIMETFVESYDFDGITVIPFCTSGSSGIGNSGKNLAEKAGSGTWLDGERFSGSDSDEKLQFWVESYN